MAARSAVVVVALLAAGPASAEPSLAPPGLTPTSELARTASQLATLAPMTEAPRALRVDLDAGAVLAGGASARQASLDVTSMLALTLRSDRHDLAQAGLALRGRAAGTVEVRAWASLAIPDGITFANRDDAGKVVEHVQAFALHASAEVEVDTALSLAAPRAFRPGTYTQHRYQLELEIVRVPFADDDHGISVAPFTLGQARVARQGPVADDGLFASTLGVAFGRFYGRRAPGALADRSIDVIDLQLDVLAADRSALVATARPVRATGVGLGSDRLLLDATAGVATTAGSSTTDNNGSVTIVTTRGLPLVTTGVASAAIAIGDARRSLRAEGARSLTVSPELELVVENRGTLRGQLQSPTLSTRLELFGGTDRRWVDDGAPIREAFAGGALDLDWRAWSGAWVGVRTEAVGSSVTGIDVTALATVSVDLRHRVR